MTRTATVVRTTGETDITITLDLDDEEMTAIIGTDIIVFTRVR